MTTVVHTTTLHPDVTLNWPSSRELRKIAIFRRHLPINEETRELPGERDNAKNNARCTHARKPRTVWMDNIKTWTGLSVEESIRMTEDRDKWRKYVHGLASPRIEDG